MDRPSLWPVEGVITSGFGWRTHPITGETLYHEGLDIADDYGNPVKATATGTVMMSSYVTGYGNLVEINHNNGITTRYGHNSLLLVSVGQKVHIGDIIALVGSTGTSTGPHVHYEIRINGTPIDPSLFMMGTGKAGIN